MLEVIALLVIVVGLLLSWPLGRVTGRIGVTAGLIAGLVGRVAVVAVMSYSAVRALEHGGPLFAALAVLFVLIAAGAVLTTAITVFALYDRFVRRGSAG